MAYLYFRDYKRLIQSENLNQIIGNDNALIEENESVGVSEIKSYLVQKYDVNSEFTDIVEFKVNTNYAVNQRVYLNATTYAITTSYAINDLTLYNGNVYVCLSTTTGAFNINDWSLLGAQYDIFYSFYTNGFFDYYRQYLVNEYCIFDNKIYKALRQSTGVIPTSDTTIWSFQSNYSTTGSLPTNTSYWKLGDNRNQQIVNYLIDIVLYHTLSRISPRNIPELRVKRYDDAIAWLKNCAKGDDITANLTKIQPTQGMRIRFGGSNTKHINQY